MIRLAAHPPTLHTTFLTVLALSAHVQDTCVVYVYAYVLARECVGACACASLCLYVCVCAHAPARVCACVGVYVRVRACVCVCVRAGAYGCLCVLVLC